MIKREYFLPPILRLRDIDSSMYKHYSVLIYSHILIIKYDRREINLSIYFNWQMTLICLDYESSLRSPPVFKI